MSGANVPAGARFALPTLQAAIRLHSRMSSTSQHVAVIGAGPAGLMAAEVLAQGGAYVTVYDAMPSAGRKFLMAGRGGLNLTHSEPLPQFLARYREAMPHLKAAIEAFPPQALRDWSEALGQETFVGTSGRVFPKAFKASPLLRAWLRRLDSMGVKLALRHRWTGWDEVGPSALSNAGWTAMSSRRARPCWRLVAQAGRGLGSDGTWAETLTAKDVQISPLRPANSGFTVAWSDIFRDRFEGQPLKGVALTFGRTQRPRRSHRHPHRHRGRCGLCAVGRAARSHYPFRSGDAARGAAARSRHEGADREGLGAEGQTVPVEFPAQGRQPLTRCDRIAAGGSQGIRHFARVAVAARPCQPHQRRPDRTHRHSPDCARDLDRRRDTRSANSTATSCSVACPACSPPARCWTGKRRPAAICCRRRSRPVPRRGEVR